METHFSVIYNNNSKKTRDNQEPKKGELCNATLFSYLTTSFIITHGFLWTEWRWLISAPCPCLGPQLENLKAGMI